MSASETFSEAVQRGSTEETAQNRLLIWIGWLPLILLSLLTIALRAELVPWVFMWLLAAAIFAGCKWLTWWQARLTAHVGGHWKRDVAYLLFWPGMDAREFFHTAVKLQIAQREWFEGMAKGNNSALGAAPEGGFGPFWWPLGHFMDCFTHGL